MMDWQELIFYTMGGLALFLYGVTLISHGLQKSLGQKAAKLLEKATDKPIKGLMVGAGVTTVFQSSSLTLVTLIGLVNASLLNLPQAISVLLGAEIGTTITAQIISLNIKEYLFPIIALGFLLSVLPNKKQGTKYAGQAILGFGILFLGMDLMKSGVSSLKDLSYFHEMITSFATNPLTGVLVAAVFTGIIQSSSATTGLVIAMATQGLVPLESAIPLILGANIGTTVTGLLASIGSSKTAKRLSLVHVIFNVTGVSLVLIFLPQFIDIVSTTASSSTRQIANAHTIFNVSMAAVSIFFVPNLARLVTTIIPGVDVRRSIDGPKYLEESILSNPPIALAQAKKEILRVAQKADKMLKKTDSLYRKFDKVTYKQILNEEDQIDVLYSSINKYLTKITEKPISMEISEALASNVHTISDLERISDHVRNIAKSLKYMQSHRISVSAQAKRDINKLSKEAQVIFAKCKLAIKKEDPEILLEVREMKHAFDDLEKQVLDNHVKRLRSGKCRPESDIVFVNIVRNIGSIPGHSMNIVQGVTISNHSKGMIK